MLRTLAIACVGILATAASATGQAVRTVDLDAADLVYSPLTGRLYASVTTLDSIVEINPATASLTASFPVGSQPKQLAISDTGEYLYVNLDGLPGVVRVHLPTRTVGTPFTLGPPDPVTGTTMKARDLAVLPGTPDAVAVLRVFRQGLDFDTDVTIYDSGVQRPNVAPGGGELGFFRIVAGADAGRLYGWGHIGPFDELDYGLTRLDVSAPGVTVLDRTELVDFALGDIKYFGGRLFSPGIVRGFVIDPEARAVVAGLSSLDAVEPTVDVLYGVSGSQTMQLFEFDPVTFAQRFAKPLPPVANGGPRAFVSLGPDSLAIATSAPKIVLVTPSLLRAAPSLTITGPTTPGITFSADPETRFITLTGTVTDPDSTSLIITWTRGQTTGTATGTSTWTADVPVAPGSNSVEVTVTDEAGLTDKDQIFVDIPFSKYLAEGATGNFFDFDLALANWRGSSDITARITYFSPAGAIGTQSVLVPAKSRRTIRVDDHPGLENTAVSTRVSTTTRDDLGVERTTRWGQAPDPQYGAHGDKATDGGALRWYFAEGSQGFFYTYLLLANASDSSNTATIDWLVEGGSPVQRAVSLPPRSRTTIDAGADPALVGRSFGIVVTFTTPAIAERAMYFGAPPDVLFKGGHDSAGVTAPSTDWFFAEGATGPFFETYILLANPNATAVGATLRFLTQGGVQVDRTVTIAPYGRYTVDIEYLSPAAPELANAAVATVVTATQPIVAERAQYWPGLGVEWYEAHNAFGVTAANQWWGLAEGRVGNPPGLPWASYQTYILLANPGTAAATVTVEFLRETGAPILRTFAVPAASRLNVSVGGPGSMVPELMDENFGAYIESDRLIVVERSLYGNAGSQAFGIGTNATGTPLPRPRQPHEVP